MPPLLFCENPLNRQCVDEEYQSEYLAAQQLGLPVFLVNFEALVNHDLVKAVRNISLGNSVQTMVYRGWMLKPSDYTLLYDALLEKNYRLINTPQEYQNCHYLPDSLAFIEPWTPRTVWMKMENQQLDEAKMFHLLKEFGTSPLIVKDYVKSQKHNWDSACFIPDASDQNQVRKVVTTFLDWQGDDLNEGLVFREYVPLENLTQHSKSGMPLKQEYRLFFLAGDLLECRDYWEEGDYSRFDPPPLEKFVGIAKKVDSRFFTMDIAKSKSGEWIIIELGDAQVAGLPDKTDRNHFYERLANEL